MAPCKLRHVGTPLSYCRAVSSDSRIHAIADDGWQVKRSIAVIAEVVDRLDERAEHPRGLSCTAIRDLSLLFRRARRIRAAQRRAEQQQPRLAARESD